MEEALSWKSSTMVSGRALRRYIGTGVSRVRIAELPSATFVPKTEQLENFPSLEWSQVLRRGNINGTNELHDFTLRSLPKNVMAGSSENSAPNGDVQDARKKRKRDGGEAIAKPLEDCKSLMEIHKRGNEERWRMQVHRCATNLRLYS